MNGGDTTTEAKVYARIEKYFLSALAMDKQNRIAWLNHALSDDLDILKEVKLLLSAHHESDNFLQEFLKLYARRCDVFSNVQTILVLLLVEQKTASPFVQTHAF